MSDAFEKIFGKTIKGVCVRRNKGNPAGQVFLVFNDDTYYEFYSYEYIKGAGGVDKDDLDEVTRITSQREGSAVFCEQQNNEKRSETI